MDIKAVKKLYETHADAEKAKGMEWYMKYQFKYLGIQKPLRSEISKPIFLWGKKADYEDLKNLCVKLWNLPEREYNYLAMELLVKNKAFKFRNSILLFEQFIQSESWWDTVDAIAANLVGPYFLAFPAERDKYLEKWWASENMWLQRTCIIFQLTYKEKTDEALLFTFCDELKGSKEFFIQKAIGWALRQYARTNAKHVIEFVNTHDLKPLSKREALKHFR